MFSNRDWRPLRRSSTTRLPLFNPTSVRSPPSSPRVLRLSIQPSKAAKLAPELPTAGAGVGETSPALIAGAAGSAEASTGETAIGRLSAPANTVILPSVCTRNASSAPTRLTLSNRGRPRSRLTVENPASAFGALATMVPSSSRSTMSRMRTAMRLFSSSSMTVPPIST